MGLGFNNMESGYSGYEPGKRMIMDELFKKLDKAIVEDDPEEIHIIYDAIVEQRLIELDSEFIEKLNRKVDGFSRWYA